MRQRTITGLMLVWILGVFADKETDPRAGAWCQYIRTTTEPQVIAYNRIGKCGSSTVERVIDRQISESGDGNLHAWHTEPHFWTRHDGREHSDLPHHEDSSLRKQQELLNKMIYSKVSDGTRLIVDGHWNFYDMASGWLRNTSIQHMQLSRSCEARVTSHLLYHLQDSVVARRAKHTGQYLAFVRAATGQSLTTGAADGGAEALLEQCLSNYSCVQGLAVVRESLYDGAVLDYFCDASCASTQQLDSQWAGAMRRVHSPSAGYAVVGVLEQLGQFLEMLECAFPTAFGGAAQRYAQEPIHTNNSTARGPSTSSTAMKRFASEACIVENRLYDEIRATAASRYRAMKSHRELCCRTRPQH